MRVNKLHFQAIALPKDSHCVILIPRVASRSMEVALRPSATQLSLPIQHAWIRDPQERLASFWYYTQNVKPWDDRFRFLFTTYEGLVDQILDNNWQNKHVIPQTSVQATDWHLYETLAEDWQSLYPQNPLTQDKWIGLSRRKASGFDPAYRSKELATYYAADIALRESL